MRSLELASSSTRFEPDLQITLSARGSPMSRKSGLQKSSHSITRRHGQKPLASQAATKEEIPRHWSDAVLHRPWLDGEPQWTLNWIKPLETLRGS